MPLRYTVYQDAQIELMEDSAPVRDALLAQYSLLLDTYASESSGMSVPVPVSGTKTVVMSTLVLYSWWQLHSSRITRHACTHTRSQSH